jgi:hypothetical protein
MAVLLSSRNEKSKLLLVDTQYPMVWIGHVFTQSVLREADSFMLFALNSDAAPQSPRSRLIVRPDVAPDMVTIPEELVTREHQQGRSLFPVIA